MQFLNDMSDEAAEAAAESAAFAREVLDKHTGRVGVYSEVARHPENVDVGEAGPVGEDALAGATDITSAVTHASSTDIVAAFAAVADSAVDTSDMREATIVEVSADSDDVKMEVLFDAALADATIATVRSVLDVDRPHRCVADTMRSFDNIGMPDDIGMPDSSRISTATVGRPADLHFDDATIENVNSMMRAPVADDWELADDTQNTAFKAFQLLASTSAADVTGTIIDATSELAKDTDVSIAADAERSTSFVDPTTAVGSTLGRRTSESASKIKSRKEGAEPATRAGMIRKVETQKKSGKGNMAAFQAMVQSMSVEDLREAQSLVFAEMLYRMQDNASQPRI